VIEQGSIVLILAISHKVGLVHLLLLLVLLDVRTHALTCFVFKLIHVVPVVHYVQRHLGPKTVDLPVLLLTCQYSFVKKLIILTRIKSVVLNVRIVRLVVLVFGRFKLFLFIHSFVVVDEHWIDLIAHFLRLLDSPSHNLSETHSQVIEFVVLKVLRMVDEG